MGNPCGIIFSPVINPGLLGQVGISINRRSGAIARTGIPLTALASKPIAMQNVKRATVGLEIQERYHVMNENNESH